MQTVIYNSQQGMHSLETSIAIFPQLLYNSKNAYEDWRITVRQRTSDMEKQYNDMDNQ